MIGFCSPSPTSASSIHEAESLDNRIRCHYTELDDECD